MRWLMASDVCKHCTHAACLEVCPTGALFRTEFGTVVVQEDICNGCGYCVPGLPVRRARPARGRRPRVEVHALLRPAQGRQGAGLRAGVPDRLDPVRRARRPARARRARGSRSCTTPALDEARLYGADDDDGVGGFGAFFLLLDEPEVYGLPPDPVDTDARPRRDLGGGRRGGAWRSAAGVAAAVLGGAAMSAGWRDARRPRSTTAGRSSSRRSGRRRSRSTSSPAGWPAPRRRSRCSPGCAATTSSPAARGRSRSPASVVSPALLISDLGAPERFLQHAAMFKVTSPMSVGSWVLARERRRDDRRRRRTR